jgi:hypothetical protein
MFINVHQHVNIFTFIVSHVLHGWQSPSQSLHFIISPRFLVVGGHHHKHYIKLNSPCLPNSLRLIITITIIVFLIFHGVLSSWLVITNVIIFFLAFDNCVRFFSMKFVLRLFDLRGLRNS